MSNSKNEPASKSVAENTVTLEQEIETIEKAEHIVEETPLRILGYFGRLGRLAGLAFSKGSRYIAYTSDVGESLRPVVDRRFVTAGYVVATAYVVTDVSLKAIEARDKKLDIVRTVAHQTTFQVLASLLIPSVVIHQAVHISQKQFIKMGRYTKWGPVIVGLATIPFLPVCVDQPVEHGIEYLFDRFWPEKEKHQ